MVRANLSPLYRLEIATESGVGGGCGQVVRAEENISRIHKQNYSGSGEMIFKVCC